MRLLHGCSASTSRSMERDVSAAAFYCNYWLPGYAAPLPPFGRVAARQRYNARWFARCGDRLPDRRPLLQRRLPDNPEAKSDLIANPGHVDFPKSLFGKLHWSIGDNRPTRLLRRIAGRNSGLGGWSPNRKCRLTVSYWLSTSPPRVESGSAALWKFRLPQTPNRLLLVRRAGSVLKSAAGSRYPGVEARSEFLDPGRLINTDLPKRALAGTCPR